MYDYDDFYNEPSEFDMQVDEFKQSLLNSVKDEYKADMERLRKENADLQEVKQNFDQIKREYEKKKIELEHMKRNLRNEVRRERITELMGDFGVELFRASSKWQDGPKCNKCDDKRIIHYTSPLGQPKQETCDCKNSIKYYEPQSYLCSSFEVRDRGFIAWYKAYEIHRADGMEFEFISSSSTPMKIYAGEEFETLDDPYYIHFKSKEECQAYCDWLTAKEGQER